MKIVTAPHPRLREIVEEVKDYDKKFYRFLHDLADTLLKKDNPKGVGLASVQVDKNYRSFAAILGETNQNSDRPEVELFINPRIIAHSQDMILGLQNGEERFEGCLSIPMFYGPVPRYSWIEVEYDSLSSKQLRQLNNLTPTKRRARFDDFDARVIQHEYDHLDGILFTDHILKHDLPLYIEEDGQFVKVSNKKEILRLL